VAAIGGVAALVLFGLAWAVAERQVFPRYRARLYQVPLTSIQSIRVSPGTVQPLVDRDVLITDPGVVQKVMTAIRTAKPYSPNHPATRWSCRLTILSSSGVSYVDVNESLGQGTILYGETGAGIIFDTLQSTALGSVLEDATEHRSSSSAGS
jgi:hypothetical protein